MDKCCISFVVDSGNIVDYAPIWVVPVRLFAALLLLDIISYAKIQKNHEDCCAYGLFLCKFSRRPIGFSLDVGPYSTGTSTYVNR